MTPARLLLQIALVPLTLLTVGSLTLLGMRLYDAQIFPTLQPERALRAIFRQPDKVQIIRSSQSGAFMIGKHAMYTAKLEATGEGLQLQQDVEVSENPKLSEMLSGTDSLCAELLKQPLSELQFYAGGDDDSEVYGVQHLPSHRYCFNYLQL